MPAAIRAGLLIPWPIIQASARAIEVAALVSADKIAQVAASRGCVDTHGDGRRRRQPRRSIASERRQSRRGPSRRRPWSRTHEPTPTAPAADRAGERSLRRRGALPEGRRRRPPPPPRSGRWNGGYRCARIGHASRSDRLERRPRLAKSAPAGGAVPGVEVDVKVRAELVQMLKVEPVPRPVLDGLIGPGAGLTDIIVGQPGQRLDSSAGGRRQVAVAALASLLVQKLESAAELALPSHAEKRPEPEDMRRVELPDDPGTLLAQDGRGAVEQLQGGRKAAPEELDASGREGCHADGMGVTDLLRQSIGGLDQPCRPARGGPALGGRVDCFPRHGQGNPQRLSSPQSSDQSLRLPGGPLDHVHEADTQRERARDVDPK